MPPDFFLFAIASNSFSLNLVPVFLGSFGVASGYYKFGMSEAVGVGSTILTASGVSFPLPLPLLTPMVVPKVSGA